MDIRTLTLAIKPWRDYNKIDIAHAGCSALSLGAKENRERHMDSLLVYGAKEPMHAGQNLFCNHLSISAVRFMCCVASSTVGAGARRSG